MNFLKKLNGLTDTLTPRETKDDYTSYFAPDINLITKVEIKKVLICRPNHRLGNLLLITPLLQEIIETFPHAEIDLFVKGNLAPCLFKNYRGIRNVIELPRKPIKNLLKYLYGWIKLRKKRYDIVINVVKNSSSGRLSAHFANSKLKFFGDINADIQLKYKDHEHMAKYPVYGFRNYLNNLGFPKKEKQISSLNLKLNSLEIAAGKIILNKLVNNEKKTICLYTYATGEKCYSKLWWQELYEKLKAGCPEYNIIEILPIENISQISFKAPSFYSKDLRQIGAVIANTIVFIGADSGMMHLASSVQIPTVGLFKVTNSNIYAPYNNNSVAINTTSNSIDDCIRILNRILSHY